MVVAGLIIAALMVIGIAIVAISRSGTRPAQAPPGRDRFRTVGPGEARPKQPRATGLD